MTHYETMGVAATATQEEVKAAHRSLGRRHHPDLTAARDFDSVRESGQRMAEINAAYDILSVPSRRAEYDAWLGAGGASRPRITPRPPEDFECHLCGHAPARTTVVRQSVGKLLWREYRRLELPMCGPCARALLSDRTNATLITGWWGPLASICNVGAILGNLLAYLQTPRTRPQPPDDVVLTPFPRPASKPPILLRRAGVYVTAGAFLVLGSLVADTAPRPTTVSASSGNSSARQPGAQAPITIDDFDGLCLRYDASGDLDDVVACTGPHDARIVATVSIPSQCPDITPYYFELPPGVLCVDE